MYIYIRYIWILVSIHAYGRGRFRGFLCPWQQLGCAMHPPQHPPKRMSIDTNIHYVWILVSIYTDINIHLYIWVRAISRVSLHPRLSFAMHPPQHPPKSMSIDTNIQYSSYMNINIHLYICVCLLISISVCVCVCVCVRVCVFVCACECQTAFSPSLSLSLSLSVSLSPSPSTNK